MFRKKSNLCCGQNAFLSHYNRSLLKACQKINEILFAQLPTPLHLIQQISAFSETQTEVKLRGHTGWGVEESWRIHDGEVGSSQYV
jgi:hypothetical protein